ncbi:Lhr family helicase [Streptomyces sp. INA 01156]
MPRGHYGSLTAAARGTSRTGPPTVAGRWSLLPDREADLTVRAHALARTLLDRHGVVTGAVSAEGVEGGFSAVYRVLSAFEETGQARRGYVVEGLGPPSSPWTAPWTASARRPTPASGGAPPGPGRGGPDATDWNGRAGAAPASSTATRSLRSPWLRPAHRRLPRPCSRSPAARERPSYDPFAGRRTGRTPPCAPSSWPPPIPRTRTVPHWAGQSLRRAPDTSPAARRARWWCSSTVS